VGPIVSVQPWDEYGHRTFVMATSKGNVPVVQGITEITPTYTKVEGMLVENAFIWDMRIATSSIPRDTLSKILLNHLDPKNPDDRLRVVRLYIQSERYQDASRELKGVLKDFPDLVELKKQVTALEQAGARRIVKEIEQRQAAGQHQLAMNMLANFPSKGAAGETRLEVKEMLEEYGKRKKEGDRVLALLDTHMAEITDESTPEKLARIVKEIKSELNIHTLSRFEDYLRLADDGSRVPEQKLALAISGWLMGSGAGIENLNTAVALVEVRDLIAGYLRAVRPHEREDILARLKSMEGAEPRYVAKMIALLPPPLPPASVAADMQEEAPPPAPEKARAPGDDVTDDAAALLGADKNTDDEADEEDAKEKKAPAAPQAQPVAQPPGYFRLNTAGLVGEPDIVFHVQLPPEYHPARRYPCIVTLSGSGSSPLQQLSWWAGDFDAKTGMRLGQASRHGYVVIAPEWSRPHQTKYEYTAREHSAVLYSLRDACRRFSIDTDRVFLSGHSMGGDAAWDIGLAHPDLWAGVLPVVATVDKDIKYIAHYSENGRYTAFYFVCGELDGDRMDTNSRDFDRYLRRSGYDVMVIEYQGRGHEHFQDEIHHMFQWMNLHKRDFAVREFECNSMRPWDNFFWWAELSAFPPRVMVAPAAWPAAGARAATTEGKILENNSILLKTAAGKSTIWLSPEFVDFEKRVLVNGKAQSATPSLEVLLEDARTRADRQHPFWAKIEG
jgi:predicted esterase